MKPAPPATTMRRLADITRRRRSVSRGIPLFSPKSSFRWLAEQALLDASSLLKDLSKVLNLAKYGGVLAVQEQLLAAPTGLIAASSVGLSRLIQSRAAGRNSVSIRALVMPRSPTRHTRVSRNRVLSLVIWAPGFSGRRCCSQTPRWPPAPPAPSTAPHRRSAAGRGPHSCPAGGREVSGPGGSPPPVSGCLDNVGLMRPRHLVRRHARFQAQRRDHLS